MPNFTPACRLVTDFTHGETCKITVKHSEIYSKKKKNRNTYAHSRCKHPKTEKQDNPACAGKTKQQMAGVLTVTHMAQVDEEALRLALKNSRVDLVSGKCGSLMAAVIHIEIKRHKS